MSKQVLVLSRYGFDNLLHEHWITDVNVEDFSDTCFISINHVGTELKVPFQYPHENVLTLLFDDVEETYINSFTIEQAKQIKNFLQRNSNKDKFIVHCAQGISRSGAVGEYIVNFFQLDFKEFKKVNPQTIPNQHVLRTLNSLFYTE